LQLIVNPNPALNQYQAPMQRHFVVDDLTTLGSATPPVLVAAQQAGMQWIPASVVYSLLFVPSVLLAVVWWKSRRPRMPTVRAVP
jgi:hypothetical protein